jgi:hypothetical protein
MKYQINESGEIIKPTNIEAKKNGIWIAIFVFLISIIVYMYFSKSKPIISENNKNGKNISNYSKSEIAVISDADGFTNLRSGKGTNYSIIQKIFSNKKFDVYPSSEKWWKVKTNNGSIGYIFHNRVDLLNKVFYIINVRVTKTERKALSEVNKLKDKGYPSGHLWIPNYKSLSGTKLYSVYIGPFQTQDECEIEVEKYKEIYSKAFGTLVSQENKRVEIRGIDRIKTIYNHDHKSFFLNGLYLIASKRLLNDTDVKYLSNYELRIMRNEIFARYGHSFNLGGEMERYFNNQNWYFNKNIDATMLISKIEQKNIAFIQIYENKNKTPL